MDAKGPPPRPASFETMLHRLSIYVNKLQPAHTRVPVWPQPIGPCEITLNPILLRLPPSWGPGAAQAQCQSPLPWTKPFLDPRGRLL